MLEASLERIVRAATAADDSADLHAARRAFSTLTGEFSAKDAWYETRIRFFLDWYVCEWRADDGARPIRHLDGEDRRWALACMRSARSLYRVSEPTGEHHTLEDLLGGGRFRAIEEGRLRAGDVFDGRLVARDGVIRVAPGIVFHPARTHEALQAVLDKVRSGPFERIEVLNGLLRMRMRHDHFTSIRAEHVYRYEDLGEVDILAASWARR